MSVQLMRPTGSRLEALYADPLLTGDLLLVALAWDFLIQAKDWPITFRKVEKITGLHATSTGYKLSDDMPRYQPPDRPRHCQNIGPRGGRCPRSSYICRPLHDPDDGTISYVASCSLVTHRAWGDNVERLHREAMGVRTPPKPAYNTRSKIAHHFPEIDWVAWWSKQKRYGEYYDIARDPQHDGGLVLQRPKLKLVGA